MAVVVMVTDPFTSKCTAIQNIDLEVTLGDLKKEIFKETEVNVSEQELMYLGEVLEDENRTLQSYGIRNNTTIYLLQKPEESIETDEQPEALTVDEAKNLLTKAKNQSYRKMLKKLMKNKESVEKLLNENPFLKHDRTISALLRDPDLSLAVLESLTPERIIEEQPMLGIALKIVLSNLPIMCANNESMRFPILLPNAAGGEDEEDYEGMDPSFLAQAEMMVSAEEGIQQRQQQQQSEPTSSQQQAQQQSRQISAADLANALQFANMNQSTSAPTSQPSESTNTVTTSTPDYAQELEQMRTFGMTDDEVSRRALVMSGGNVEMALNIIFEGMLP